MNTLQFQNAASLIGRVMLAVTFILSGYGKIGGYTGTATYMASQGVPGWLLPLVIAVELIGGLMIVVGFQTRWAALALAGFTILAGILFHYQPAVPAQMIAFMKNVSITGGFLVLAAFGPGAWSLDARRRGTL